MRDLRQAALEAEEFRRTHCDNPERRGHKCMGKVTIAPGFLMLDCVLCGGQFVPTSEAIKELDFLQEEENKRHEELFKTCEEIIKNHKPGDPVVVWDSISEEKDNGELERKDLHS